MDSGSDTRPAHAHNTSWSNIDRTYTQPGLLRSFVPLYSAGSQLCLQKALYFMTLTPPPKAKLSNKAPLQGPLGPCLPPRSSGSSVVGLEVSSGAQNPVPSFILKQPSMRQGHYPPLEIRPGTRPATSGQFQFSGPNWPRVTPGDSPGHFPMPGGRFEDQFGSVQANFGPNSSPAGSNSSPTGFNSSPAGSKSSPAGSFETRVWSLA